MKIAVLARGFAGWTGGVDFIRNVNDSLACVAAENGMSVTLVLPGDGPFCRLAALGRMLPTISRDITRGRKPRLTWPGVPDGAAVLRAFADSAPVQTVQVDSGRWPLARALKRAQAQVAVPALRSLGRSFPIPWVGYLFDFQHRYLPQFFRAEEIRQRNVEFGKMLREAKCIIVNARAVRADAQRFHPDATARIVSLPFSGTPHRDWLVPRPQLLTRYELEKPYFLISNQFWRHKDHETAIEAFRICAAGSRSVSLVCTGVTQDHRDPKYFPALRAKIEAAGLSDRIRILGHIPKRDQIEIMKNCVAVLQPTLFEGGPGGGSVHNAVALGVPSIVSDIPVNLEMEESGVSFFRAGDAEDLAQKMRAAMAAERQAADVSQLLAAGLRRQQRYGAGLLEAIRYAMA